ncbi:MAG: 2TM domain-containing protein [Bacteroidota bacterium]
MDDNRYYERAKKRVEEKKNFHHHLRSYIVVNLIMLFTGAFFRGWKWVAFFWGLGVFSHFVKAYGFMGMGADSEWEEQEIEREVQRMKKRAKYRSDRNPPHQNYDQGESDFDVDDYLDLDQPKPMPRKSYDEEDLV